MHTLWRWLHHGSLFIVACIVVAVGMIALARQATS